MAFLKKIKKTVTIDKEKTLENITNLLSEKLTDEQILKFEKLLNSPIQLSLTINELDKHISL